MQDSQSESYKAAGVDVVAGYESVERIRPLVESTYTKGVLGSIGGFGGLFAPDLSGMERPVLISGADGVGTKLRLAFALDRHDTVGIDCVAMCVNDIICCGAKPLFFLDYIACGKVVPENIEQIVEGIAAGCRMAGAALVGGETAEHPGVMEADQVDLAGFAAGIVDRKNIIDGRNIKVGDAVIGLASSGVHSNGFSLVRKLFGEEVLKSRPQWLSKSLGEALLTPTKIYVKPILSLIEKLAVKGIVHITGGGFYENIQRVLPAGVGVEIDTAKIPKNPLFDIIQAEGNILKDDMFGTYNMGIGMIVIVDKSDTEAAVAQLTASGESAVVLGEVIPDRKGLKGRLCLK